VSEPFSVFERWYREAEAAGVPQVEAMALSSATPQGRPSVRFVLYRGRSGEGLRFFTNYESRKGRELEANPVAAAVFYWHAVARQVRVEGRILRTSSEESDEYFRQRPRGSQLAAWASPQSQPLAYTELERRYAALEASHAGREIPRPPFWGGFVLVAERFEFWQGGEHRLHRRVVWTRGDAGWTEEEVAP
jgi:pyridoxamine 5'-phosphate oxidase